MRHIRFLVIGGLLWWLGLVARAAPAAPGADAILGRWQPADREVVVELVKSGAGYTGRVVRCLRKPELVGSELWRAVTFDGARAEWSGELFAVRRGRFVPMKARLRDDGALAMTAGSGWLSKELVWTRP